MSTLFSTVIISIFTRSFTLRTFIFFIGINAPLLILLVILEIIFAFVFWSVTLEAYSIFFNKVFHFSIINQLECIKKQKKIVAQTLMMINRIKINKTLDNDLSKKPLW